MKISVIMQSYLGDYPGSRSNPEAKFIRAVNSFLNQTYEDKELIIVSDGCEITHKIYNEKYKNISSIKYCYLNKNSKKTYESDDHQIFYSGAPRGVGLFLASGEIITYLDSDDIILKNRLQIISDYVKENPDNYVWRNKNALFDINVMKNSASKDKQTLEEAVEYYDKNNLKLTITEEEYGLNKELFKMGLVHPGTFSFIHRKTCDAKWRDVFRKRSEAVVSEDSLFAKDLAKYNQIFIGEATYVICHLGNISDI